ncbi:hypothetical protein ACFV42_23010 [Streptomyces solisilvae]|uniref:hypothetical protein n=1 Tax=Streptomyces malaysiensis TaxID=92644 RepID=UPI00368DB51A
MTTPTPDTRPQVDVSDELSARRALRRWMAAQPDLYDQRGTLVRWDACADGGRGALVVLDAERLADYCADRVETVKVGRSGDARSALLPARLAKALMRAEGAGLRPLEGVSRWPLVRPDGTVTAAAGYDPATRFIIAGGDDVKPVPDQPTAEDIGAARAVLRRLFGGFPYASRDREGGAGLGADYAHTIGLYLSPLLRTYLPASARSPLHVVTATGPGSGKSYLSTEGIEAVFSTRRMAAEQSDRELQKTLIAALETQADAAVIAFDNFATGGQVTGAAFARWVTEPKISGRVIGTGRTPTFQNTYTWVVNGNRVRLGGDMARRSVVISLESDADDPSTVEHPFDFLEEISARRGEVLWALLTLVRAWTVKPAARRPVRAVQLGQFSQWMTAVASILDNAGIGGFNENRAAVMAEADEMSADFGRFYWAVREVLGGGWLRAAQICGRPELQDLIPREAGQEDRIIGHRALGRRVLRPQTGRVFTGPGGEKLTVRERWDSHAKRWLYRVVDVAVARVARAARRTAATVRRASAAVASARPAATLAAVLRAGRGRREREERAARGVRVEGDLLRRASAALDGVWPSAT